MTRRIVRREFLKRSALGTALSAAATRRLEAVPTARPVAPSDRVVVGFLGTGRQAVSILRHFLQQPDVRVAALCDVYEPNLKQAVELAEAPTYEDFRRVLERPDIDAVVIASPDHWHALMTVMACQAGKDVYVEKPVSVAVEEGRRMVEAVQKYDRVAQVGTQQRSGLHYQKAVEIVRRGDLGKITAVRAWNFANSFPEGIGNVADGEPPPGLNWDLWLGPAPKVAFNANRFGVYPGRWSTFRWFWDYAGGMMTDWGAHHFDIIQWAMQVDGPLAVSATGGKLGLRDNRETPDTLTVTYEYPGFICTYDYRENNARGLEARGYGIEFYGTSGTLFIDRRGFEILPEMRREGGQNVPRMQALQEENTVNQLQAHVRNFLDCVKSRQAPISDIEAGHLSAAACHLGNIAYRAGRKIRWDARREEILEDREAAALLRRAYRSPWKLGG